MKVLFIGDVVGSPGVGIVKKAIPILRANYGIACVIANGENATNGSGLSPRDYRQLRSAGVDAITLGDHIYKKYEIAEIMRSADEPICKLANFPPVSPGRDCILLPGLAKPVLVIALLGRTYMRAVDCPYAAVDRVLAEQKLTRDQAHIIVDIHAEATADKYLMFHHLKGRVSAVLGTHTHIPTADEQVQDGTAFQCDVGMTGPYASILGRRVDRVLNTAISFTPSAFDVATEDVRLSGAIIDIQDSTGEAVSIERVCLREAELV